MPSTTPATPPASIKSPTLNGRKAMIITPDAKLAKEPCNAKPRAKPAAPIMQQMMWFGFQVDSVLQLQQKRPERHRLYC